MLRDPGTIEAELRLLAADRGECKNREATLREITPTAEQIDELLDEWNRSLAVLESYGFQLWPD